MVHNIYVLFDILKKYFSFLMKIYPRNIKKIKIVPESASCAQFYLYLSRQFNLIPISLDYYFLAFFLTSYLNVRFLIFIIYKFII